MKKIFLIIMFVSTNIAASFGQGGFYSFDFEDTIDNANWQFSSNWWQIGLMPTTYATSYLLYVPLSYSNYINTYTYAYRTIFLNEGNSQISFDWYGKRLLGNASRLFIFLIPDSCELNFYFSSFSDFTYQIPEGSVSITGVSGLINDSDGGSPYDDGRSHFFSTSFQVPQSGSYKLLIVWAQGYHVDHHSSTSPMALAYIDNITIFNSEPYATNFENGNGESQWNYENYGGSTQWYIGNSTSHSNPTSLYISNDGGHTNSYVNGFSTVAYTYRTICLVGNCHISYDWKAAGESNGDYMRSFLIADTTSLNDLRFNPVTIPTDAIYLDNNQQLCGQTSWNHLSTTVNVVPQLYKLVFLWVNNGNGIGSNPPAAIDNFAINSRKQLEVVLTDPYHSTTSVNNDEYDYMETANVVITPTPHYHVYRLRGTGLSSMQYVSPTKDTCQIVMDNNYTLHVDVAIDTHTVQVDTRLGYGSVSVTNNGQIPYGQVCTVTADTSNSNYRFYTWSNGVTANSYTFVVTQDTSLTAIYIVPGESHLLQVTSANETMGQASITGDCIYQDLYQQGNVVLTATANYGYHFVQWSDGITANPRTLYLSNDTNLTAIFAINQYTLSLQANDAALGTATGGGSYDYLSQVTMTAVPSSHCHFVQWHDGNTTNPRLITLTQNMSFMANFAQDPQYTINVMVNDPSRGSADGGGIFFAGDYATLSAYPNEHYYFSSWSDGVNANPYYLTVIENASYTAMFEPINYTVNLTCNDDYMGSVCGGGSYPYGSTANIEAQPFDGFRFIEWSDGNTNASRSLLVEGNISLQARFGDDHTEGIDDVIDRPIMTVIGRQIVVSGAAGQNIMVYDVIGRKVAAADKATDRQELTVPASGVYIVKIDGYKSLKCVVR